MVAVLGVLTITVTRTDDMRDWRTWALLLPLGASVLRGVIPPVIKLGLEVWPNPIAAGLTGYIVSTLTVLTVERIRTGRFLVQDPLAGKLWSPLQWNLQWHRHVDAVCSARRRTRPIGRTAVCHLFPPFTVGMSVLFLHNVKITLRLVAGTALTVGGVVLVLLG